MYVFIPCATCAGLTTISAGLAAIRVFPVAAFLVTNFFAWLIASNWAPTPTSWFIIFGGGQLLTVICWFVVMYKRAAS